MNASAIQLLLSNLLAFLSSPVNVQSGGDLSCLAIYESHCETLLLSYHTPFFPLEPVLFAYSAATSIVHDTIILGHE